MRLTKESEQLSELKMKTVVKPILLSSLPILTAHERGKQRVVLFSSMFSNKFSYK